MIVAVLAVGGGLVFVDGFRLGVLEESRMRSGRVVSGVVDGLHGSGDAIWDSTRARSSRRDSYEGICRFLLTFSGDAWTVDYHYPCDGGTGVCRGGEYVAKSLWSRLEVGQPINVRQSLDETRTGRLDENPQRRLAIVKVALACMMFAVAGLVSGRLTLVRRRKYIEVDGVVTSVQGVSYGEEMRWKVRFAYFDANGNSQDSVDEVNDPSWKAGDDCRAVYRPRTPDLATLRPR